ncbi:MAG: hypothetical protein SWH68_10735 [Thermodesulfobacteriota bacterium]|nr:hypothetical protein [Thermodesulfobacteriota bacterium]
MEVLQVKITDADIIKIGEKELIDIITGDLDWTIIEDILKKKYNLTLSDDNVEYKEGDIVVHDNQVAYKLDFDVRVNLSVLFDRQGECFDIVASSAPSDDEDESDVEGGEANVSGVSEPVAAESVEGDGEEPGAAADQSGEVPAGEAPVDTNADADTSGGDQDDMNDLGKDNSEMASRIANMISDINRE